MNLIELIMTGVISLASYPTVVRDYAKRDMASGASLVYSKSLLIPDESKKIDKVADYYNLNIYCESSEDEIVPLKFIFDPEIVESQITLTFSQSEEIKIDYQGSASFDLGLSKNIRGEIDLLGLAKIKKEIGLSSNLNLSFGYNYSRSKVKFRSSSIYVDGINNKFGVYAYAYCTTNASKYYAHYLHMNYSNYDEQDMYRTYMLIEQVDGHFYLANSNSNFANKLFYFETIEEYNEFCYKWGL